ncbi:MAG: hypothetical protein IPH41_18600 [Sulfuritalea sp.]|nr:hypothetical protein [Sulfuritalea sp.]
MSRKDMSEMTKPSPGEKLQSLGKRFLLNFTFFIISSINSFTIRSDGPSGFGEVFIKILIFIVSVAALLASTISLTLIERSESRRKGAEVTYYLLTFLLAMLAILAILDACSDLGGHCRRDGIHFFNVDANSGHAFGILLAAVGALRPSGSGAS